MSEKLLKIEEEYLAELESVKHKLFKKFQEDQFKYQMKIRNDLCKLYVFNNMDKLLDKHFDVKSDLYEVFQDCKGLNILSWLITTCKKRSKEDLDIICSDLVIPTDEEFEAKREELGINSSEVLNSFLFPTPLEIKERLNKSLGIS